MIGFGCVSGLYAATIPSNHGAVVLLLGTATLGCFVLYQSAFTQVRKAKFYYGHFLIKGRNFNRSFAYSDIEDVALVKGPWPNTMVSILVKDVMETLSIPKNKYSETVGTDLYSWLKERIQSSGNAKELSNDSDDRKG